jgi:hypothetical protein
MSESRAWYHSLPAVPEDAEEAAVDAKPIRFSLDLPPPDYRLLRHIQWQRHEQGERVSLASLVRDAIHAAYGEGA